MSFINNSAKLTKDVNSEALCVFLQAVKMDLRRLPVHDKELIMKCCMHGSDWLVGTSVKPKRYAIAQPQSG